MDQRQPQLHGDSLLVDNWMEDLPDLGGDGEGTWVNLPDPGAFALPNAG